MKWLLLIATVALISALPMACQKSAGPASENIARLQIRLTDDPGDFESVFIDIQEIHVNQGPDDDNGWTKVSGVQAGIYDLLTLINDRDTLLADATLQAGKLHQMRLLLGSNNTVVVDGVTYPLTTPSAQQSGLKLNLDAYLDGGLMYVLLLDFDVARSIVKTGNGKYILKPVIRGTMEAAGGSISGVVQPADFPTVVYALKGADTITSTYTAPVTGAYQIKGLAPGSYFLQFQPGNLSFADTLLTNVNVQQGQVTRLDTLFLQP